MCMLVCKFVCMLVYACVCWGGVAGSFAGGRPPLAAMQTRHQLFCHMAK